MSGDHTSACPWPASGVAQRTELTLQFVPRRIDKRHRLPLAFGANQMLGRAKTYDGGKPVVADQAMADGAHPSALHVSIGPPEA